LITEYKLYIYHKDKAFLELRGAGELLNVCKKLCPAKTEEYLSENPLPTKNNKKVILEFCHDLYINILMDRIRSAMPSPDIVCKLDVKNGYFQLPEENKKKLGDALERLSTNLQFDEKTGEYNREKHTIAIGKESAVIEEAKLPAFEKVTRNFLEMNDRNKLIVMVNHTNTITVLMEKLKMFNPIMINGSVKAKQRRELEKKFNTDKQCRLLIGNITVLAYSMNFHDIEGDNPRVAIISPNFKPDMIHQAVSRIYRDGCKSDATAIILYGANGRLESSIFDSIVRKTPIMQQTLPEQVAGGKLFPGEYPSVDLS